MENGAAARGERVAISYKMPPNIYRKVKTLVHEEKKFSTVSDCITQALLSFIDNHHDRDAFRDQVRDYLASDEGQEILKAMTKEVLVEVLLSRQTGTRAPRDRS